MTEKEKKRQVVKISVFITSIFVIFLSISYAFINQTLTGTKSQVITAGNLELELKEGNAITLENTLPVHDEVGMIQKSYDFTLTNKTTRDSNYTLLLKDVTGEEQQKLDTTLVRYGLTKDGVVTKDLLSNLIDNTIDSGVITGNQTIQYNLRLWIDSGVKNENLIKNKTLRYKIEVEASKATARSIVFDTAAQNLGENCKTYDDGIDTFLVGQCSNNYVWYSGKLWRVVLKNNKTGAVKMITDNSITNISYNASGNAAFENSYADQWLSQEFLPTLHDYQDYLVTDSTWDITSNESNNPSRPAGTTTVQRAVGLLNVYEYYTTYNKSDGLATIQTGYLNNQKDQFSLITPSSNNRLWIMSTSSGQLYLANAETPMGIRPTINLQANIQIASGKGTLSEPYKLVGDEQDIVAGTTLLSTRYSGEYITFNKQLYRIVAKENNLTKITAVDTPEELTNKLFDDDPYEYYFDSASIKTDLENYYQNNIEEPDKSMVELNQYWYLGNFVIGDNYKATICGTVDPEVSTSVCVKTSNVKTTIGLPRVGEMFVSQITRKMPYAFMTLSYQENWVFNRIWAGGLYGLVLFDGDVINARPSMYLKSNVVISSTNTGDGTYEHPYDIELAE